MPKKKREFSPDWTSPPGNTISDLLKERAWNQRELSKRLGLSPKLVSQLIEGKIALTENIAERLAATLGSTISFWMNRENGYRASLAKLKQEKKKKKIQRWDWTNTGMRENLSGVYVHYQDHLNSLRQSQKMKRTLPAATRSKKKK